jgi:hypothetical protein
MCWTPLEAINTNNVNKTCTLLQTTGCKDKYLNVAIISQKLLSEEFLAISSPIFFQKVCFGNKSTHLISLKIVYHLRRYEN